MNLNCETYSSQQCCSQQLSHRFSKKSYFIILITAFIFAQQCQLTVAFAPRQISNTLVSSIDIVGISNIQLQAATIDSPSGSMSNFQERMKKIVQSTQKNKTPPKQLPGNVLHVSTLEDYKKVIGSNKDEKLIVVRFYAPWCKVSYIS